MTKNSHITNPINRRQALAGAGAVAGALAIAGPALAGVAASLPAQAMTPEERVAHHVEGIRQAFREIHPDLKKFGEAIELRPDRQAADGSSLGSIVMICAHLKRAS